MTKKRLLLGAAAAAIHSTPAAAALTYFEAARWQTYTQNSNAQPTVRNSFGFTGRVFTNTAGEVQNGTVETPLSTVHNMSPNGGFVTAYSHFGFATEAALAAVYPAGTYTFKLTNGPRAGDSDTMVYNDPGWADAVPYLTGSTYSNLQGASVTAPITFNWGSFHSPGTFSGIQSYFYLTDLTTGTSVFGRQGAPDTFTSKTFAANTLVAGHDYQFQLVFGALEQALTTGDLAPASWTGATYIATTGRFTTAVPDPGSPLAITDVQRDAATRALTLTFTSETGKTYTVKRSTDLTTWADLATNVPATGPSTNYTDSDIDADDRQFFYRITRP